MELQKIVAANITKARGTLSRKELAKLSGVSYKHIYDIEECLRNPSLDLIEKIAKALNVEASSLLVSDSQKPVFQNDNSLDLIRKILSLDNEALVMLKGQLSAIEKGMEKRKSIQAQPKSKNA